MSVRRGVVSFGAVGWGSKPFGDGVTAVYDSTPLWFSHRGQMNKMENDVGITARNMFPKPSDVEPQTTALPDAPGFSLTSIGDPIKRSPLAAIAIGVGVLAVGFLGYRAFAKGRRRRTVRRRLATR